MARILVLAITASILAACSGPEPETTSEEPIRAMRGYEVIATTASMLRRYPTELDPSDETELAFEMGGTVASINLEVGQTVSEGEELARLDAQTAQFQLDQARAGLREAEAGFENAAANFTRQNTLFERDLVAQAALDDARANRDAAEARVDQAEQQLLLAQQNMQDLVILAPFDGIVSDVHVERFQNAAAGQAIVTIFNDQTFEANFTVPSSVIARLEVGEEAIVVVANTNFDARVTELGSRSVSSAAFPVVVTLLDPDPRLRPGLSAEVLLEVGVSNVEDGLLIPVSAFSFDSDDTDLQGRRRAVIFVFDEAASVVRQRDVVIAGVQGSDMVVIDGLEQGEIVASAGVSFLRDGQPVRLLPLEN